MEKISKRLLSWASILEDKTREQAERTASMPFIFPHVALMPDAHLGKGSTVGSVIPTLNAIIPAAVGVDIGCGMIAVCTQFTADDAKSRGDLRALREAIERAVPLSAGTYNTSVYGAQTAGRIEALEQRDGADSAEKIAPNWRLQLGSLGSGNHFIEVSLDERDRVWLFLHSGSRGVGNRLAQRHIKIAHALAKKWWIQLPDPDLAYLVEGTDEFWAYIRDLRWAQHFALLNREEMMHRVIDCLGTWFGEPTQQQEVIQCHHNYTARESYCSTCTSIQGSDSRLRERLLADETVARVRDFLACYRPFVHSCGGLLLTGVKGAPIAAPSRTDALAHGGIGPAAQAAGLARRRSRFSQSDLCTCARPDYTAFSTSSFSNRFGRDFGRPFAAERGFHRLDKVLAHIFFGEVPSIDCTSGHRQENVWLSRKGAIDASAGVPGLIPGSMGTRSYVVTGKGNRLALNSSPHGAGRLYSRSAARKTFSRPQLDSAMQGIEWRRTNAFLDEIPGAYKDVDVVMRDAADLVEIRHTLRQIVNVKGD